MNHLVPVALDFSMLQPAMADDPLTRKEALHAQF
jgi:hypothetical protein